ncbi:hypothetical protein K435DRAFT_806061 [Dendrothele bispora CBS 962.96]|uniref:Uncharacterized protein n=1 Tax=Dendrothele bispora (strain CBS 962.96) TaxID=1314807 RepID=A0A4S8L951_DENBC|nr:hypothetical protein K435DRAFT_806061 [Dendrothele bispora CBS 962.96]
MISSIHRASKISIILFLEDPILCATVEVGQFVDLIWDNPDIACWTTMKNVFYASMGKSESSLPSIRKAFTLVDDQKPYIASIFKEYFDSVTQSKEGATMVSFKEQEVQKTLESQPTRASLLDMRKFGIPALPATAEYSKTNQRLGLDPDEPNDAWFAISAATLYFVAPTDLSPEISRKMESATREAALGVLGFSIFEWLEKAASPRLLNSIAFDALTLLKEKDRRDIHNDAKYLELLQEAEKKLDKARRQRDTKQKEKWTQRVLAIKAVRTYEGYTQGPGKPTWKLGFLS